jgi:hypothetical protein
MATKSFDAALDFMPEAKASKRASGFLSTLKVVYEAFEEGRVAEARYHALVAHGVPHDVAARRVFLEQAKN